MTETRIVAPGAERLVKELALAAKDGLLDYRGYRDPDRYDVVVAKQSHTLQAGQVLDLVARLRALASLATPPASLSLVATDLDTYHVEMQGKARVQLAVELPAQQVLPWVEGYRAAAQSKGTSRHAGKDGTARIREVLTNPVLADQCRLHMMSLMQLHGVTNVELARRTGHTPKTIGSAMQLGTAITLGALDEMIQALGYRWVVGVDNGQEVRRVPAGTDIPLHQGVANLYQLLDAADNRWLRYVGPEHVNVARTARHISVNIGRTSHVLEAAAVPGWVRGVAAYHSKAL